MAAAAATTTTTPAGVGAAAVEFVDVTHWLDGASLFREGGVRGIEAALSSLNGAGAAEDESPGRGTRGVVFLAPELWQRLGALFPRR